MDWASWINVVLSGAILWLTITIFKLNKTMTKIVEDEKLSEERHQDYLRTRQGNDQTYCNEQAKMDDIIKTCSIGLIGVEFAFIGIIYKQQIAGWWLFILAVSMACFSIISIYFSSWCSVKDAKISSDKLDERYGNGGDIYEYIKTKYTPWIEYFNIFSMIFLIIGIVFFFCFVYTNYSLTSKKINNEAQIDCMEIKDMSIENIKNLCGGVTKAKLVVPPTTVKTSTKATMDGAPKSKPTLPKKPIQNSGTKK